MNDDRYPRFDKDPREMRPKQANRFAAILLVGAIVICIGLIALFG